MNLFAPPSGADGETETELYAWGGVRIVRIVSCGHRSPDGFFYDQNEDEWVSVLQGEGVLSFPSGEMVILRRGDTFLLPAHKMHRVERTSADPPCVWLCVYTAC